MMKQWYQCPNCHNSIAFEARFCGNCGTQLNWPVQQQCSERLESIGQESATSSLWDKASKILIGKSGKLFNQANEQWQRRQHFLLEGNDEKAREACVEVVRLCQQTLSINTKEGDAYVLLANALISSAYKWNTPSTREMYEVLSSRAAAVIHLWYCLPHRGYPITKNKAIGDRLWKIILDQLMHEKALNENAATNLMHLYKDNLATETISPNSFMKIREIMLNTAERQEYIQSEPYRQLLEETLQPETWGFLVNIIQKATQGELHEKYVATDPLSRVQATVEKLKDFSLIRQISMELFELWTKAYDNNDLRQALGWITWHLILDNYEKTIIPELSSETGKIANGAKSLFEAVTAITAKAIQLKQWDTVLLTVGICEWARMQGSRDELLKILNNKVSKEEIYRRLANLEREPRMAIDHFLIHYSQRALG